MSDRESNSFSAPTGVLLNDEIKRLIDKWRLVEDCSFECIQPAGYDARIGQECYLDGKLSNINPAIQPLIEVAPNDMVLVSTLETFNLPNNVVARYYLRQGLTWKGLVLLGAGQIDPGDTGIVCIDSDVQSAFDHAFKGMAGKLIDDPRMQIAGHTDLEWRAALPGQRYHIRILQDPYPVPDPVCPQIFNRLTDILRPTPFPGMDGNP